MQFPITVSEDLISIAHLILIHPQPIFFIQLHYVIKPRLLAKNAMFQCEMFSITNHTYVVHMCPKYLEITRHFYIEKQSRCQVSLSRNK